jgi:hypothetical protein
MMTNPIHHALAQVQELQQKVLEKQRFKGYSGRARAISGTLALLAAPIMSSDYFPKTITAHAVGWGTVFALALLLNFGSLVYWFFFDPCVKRDIRRLRPTLDVVPPLFVGGILTLILMRDDLHKYLFGIWMCLFGLANLASRHVLPKQICQVGWFYILCGTIYLLAPHNSFLNPWPAAIVFFVGEWAGGIILHFDGTTPTSLSSFFKIKIKESNHVRQVR